MKPYKALAWLFVAVWLFAPRVHAACPLANPADCIYADSSVCGTCNDGLTNCSSADQCLGICVGFCTDDTTPCTGDADCEGILDGQCAGNGNTCDDDGVTACFGDADCPGICSGAPGAANGTQANPFCLLQEAYDAASAGDTILAMPGTYTECLEAWGAMVVDKGTYFVADDFLVNQDNSTTVIDATGRCDAQPAVSIGGSGAGINGFTVTGGTVSGIFGQGNVTITNNYITGNVSATGGGVYVYAGSCYYPGTVTIDISNNTITGNQSMADDPGTLGEAAGDGGGLYVAVTEFNNPLTCTNPGAVVAIEGNTISDNTIENQNIDPNGGGQQFPVFGGGLYVQTSTVDGGGANVQITQNTITGNGAVAGSESYGGGAWVGSYTYGGPETIVVSQNLIQDNASTVDGGGISTWVITPIPLAAGGAVETTVTRNTISGNNAFARAGGLDLFGGLLDVGTGRSITLRADRNAIVGNTAGDDAGGMLGFLIADRTADTRQVGDGNGSITPADAVRFQIDGNTITGNTAELGGGGVALFGVANSDPASAGQSCSTAISPAATTFDLRKNFIADNTANNFLGLAQVGGGIFAFVTTIGDSDSTVNIEETTVAGNTIASGFVGGIEIFPEVEADCPGTETGVHTLNIDRSIVDGNGNTVAGIGGTPLDDMSPGILNTNVTNTWVFGHQENFDSFLFASVPPGNFTTDPEIDNQSHLPDVCSPVFDLMVCHGTTTSCTGDGGCALTCVGGADDGVSCSQDSDCDSRVCSTCVSRAGFHERPDGNGDGQVDGIDLLALALAFGTSDGDVRYDADVDYNTNGSVDGDDLSYLATQFGQVCN